ncbi:MAG: winged helix-turn-helix domain-containing protein [Candidatus Hecatellaceae archaeon]
MGLLAGRVFNPNAYLPNFRNRKVGVKARSLILNALGEKPLNTGGLKSETGLSEGSLRYHLKLLERYKLVRRIKSGRKASYQLTGLGQQPITF